MEKQLIIEKLDILKNAVIDEDVESIIKMIGDFQIDTRFSSPLEEYVKDIIVQKIFDKVTKLKTHKLKITRNTEYGGETYDYYIIEDGVLKRNGKNTKWTSLGKLYCAYKQIK